MTPDERVDYMLNDCFFAVGQAIGARKQVDYDVIVWWRDRYRGKFLHAITISGNSWSEDRERLIGVSHRLGKCALRYSGDGPSIDTQSAIRSSDEVETACHMRAKGRRQHESL